MERFTVRPDPTGFSILDAATGEVVRIAQAAQAGLSREDADHTAAVLNRRDGSADPAHA